MAFKTVISNIYNNIKRVSNNKKRSNFGSELFSWLGYAKHGASEDSAPLGTWATFASSPRDDIDKNQYVLRKRSRDLYMSNAFFGAILNAKLDGVVGRGLRLNANIDSETLGLTDDEAVLYEHKIEAAFKRWIQHAGRKNESFNDIISQCYFACLLSGDCACIVNCNYETRNIILDIVEGDCIRTPDSESNNKNVLSGVRFTNKGGIVGYYLGDNFEYNTDGLQVNYNFYSAFMAGHSDLNNSVYTMPTKKGVLFIHNRFERPGQVRGIPICSRVLGQIKQLDRYINAELDASVASAKPAVFIEHPIEQTSALQDIMDTYGISENANNTNNDIHNDDAPLNWGNGLCMNLYDGAKMQAFNPGRPNAAFSGFIDANESQIASNLGLPVEVANKKFNANYSASRAALLDAQRTFEIERSHLIRQLVTPIYNAWLDLHADILGLKNYYTNSEFRSAWRRADWIGEQLPNIDPTKEIDAALKRVQMGVSTLSREAEISTGTDIVSNIRQRGFEERLMRSNGLIKDQNGVPIDEKYNNLEGENTDDNI